VIVIVIVIIDAFKILRFQGSSSTIPYVMRDVSLLALGIVIRRSINDNSPFMI
jgi:hypothetical protein